MDPFTSCKNVVDVTIATDIKTIAILLNNAEDNCVFFCNENYLSLNSLYVLNANP